MPSQPQVKEFSVERQLRRQRFLRPEGISNADIMEAIEDLRTLLARAISALLESRGFPKGAVCDSR